MMLARLTFASLFFTLSAIAYPAQSLSLNALSNSKVLWTLKLQFRQKESCQAEGKSAGSKTLQTKKIDTVECKALQKDFADLSSEVANPKNTLKKSPETTASDQPDYQFEIGPQKFYEHLVAPADCKIDAEGKMSCAQNELSGSQRLLLRLLDYAQSMKLGTLPRRK